MNTSSIPGAAESAVPVAALPIPISPTPETPDQSLVPAIDAPVPQPVDDPAPTRVTATAVAPKASPPLATLPQSIGLQERQRIALQVLTAGNNTETAAQMAGVSPATVYRWKKYDARFIAALNAWRAESQRAAQVTLMSAVGHAAQNVLRATQTGDVRTSLTLLKGLGALAPQRPGSQLPAIVAKELATEAGLIRQTITQRPRKVSLHLLEEIFQNMEMPEAARAAYREAFARHRAALKPAPIQPLLRPATPEVIQQAALAMQPTPGRSFKFVAEPSLAEYKKYQDHLRQQEEESTAAEPAAPPVPAYLQTLAPPPVYPPKFCKVTITALSSTANRRAVSVIIANSEGDFDARPVRIPYEFRKRILAEKVERFAKELESRGATVEIRPVYEDED